MSEPASSKSALRAALYEWNESGQPGPLVREVDPGETIPKGRFWLVSIYEDRTDYRVVDGSATLERLTKRER